MRDLVIKLCTDNNWAYEFDANTDSVIFNVPLANGRMQTCKALITQSDIGPTIDIISKAGQYNDHVCRDTLVDLLKFNQALVYSRAEIGHYEDAIYIIARTLADAATEKEVILMIQEVAISADGAERAIFGTDIN